METGMNSGGLLGRLYEIQLMWLCFDLIYL